MGTIQPSMTPQEGPSVSRLRAVFEQIGAKPGEQIRLMKGQTNTSGPREASKLNSTQNPPPAQSLKSADCLKTAENVHNKATIPFVVAHNGPIEEKTPVLSQNIKLTLPLEIKHESETIETVMTQTIVPFKTSHSNVYVQEHEETTLHFPFKTPLHVTVESEVKTVVTPQKQLEAETAPEVTAEVQFEAVGTPENSDSVETTGGIDTYQPVHESPNELEQKVSAFIEQAASLKDNPEAITPEMIADAQKFIEETKSHESFDKINPEIKAIFEAVESELKSLLGGAEETKTPELHWSEAIPQQLKSENPDSKAMETAIGKMLEDIQSKAAESNGVISKDDLPQAIAARDLMEVLKESKGISTELKDTLTEMHAMMSAGIQETEGQVLLEDVRTTGQFKGIPKTYDGIGNSVLNYAQKTDQLQKHQQLLQTERGAITEKKMAEWRGENGTALKLLSHIDSMSQTLHAMVVEEKEELAATFLSQWKELDALNEKSGNKDPEIQTIISRLRISFSTLNALNAAKSIFKPAFEKLASDIQQFEKYGLDASNPQEYQQLKEIHSELAALVVKDEQVKAPSVNGAQNWMSEHLEISPKRLEQTMMNTMTATFQRPWFLKEAQMDVSGVLYVLERFKKLSPEDVGNLEKLQVLTNSLKEAVEQAHRDLGNLKPKDSRENLTAMQKEAIKNTVDTLQKLGKAAESIEKSIKPDHPYINAYKNIAGGLNGSCIDYIKQLTPFQEPQTT